MVRDEEGEGSIAPRIDEILEVLRVMPLLEDVDIPFYLDNAHPLPSTSPVALFQHLQMLKMQLEEPDVNIERRTKAEAYEHHDGTSSSRIK